MDNLTVVAVEPGKVELRDEPVETPGPRAVRVRTLCSAISAGTEIAWLRHGHPADPYPFPLGYCAAGVVEQVGSAVTGVKIGDIVAGEGFHQRQAVVRRFQVLPKNVSPEEGVFLVMAAVAIRGIRRGSPVLGESTLVVGAGIVGQLTASLARIGGAFPLIMADKNAWRLEKARARGADVTLPIDDIESFVEQVRRHCPPDGADLVYEATGNTKVYEWILRLARARGRVIALGSPHGPATFSPLEDLHLREVQFMGAFQPLTPEADESHYHWSKPRERKLIIDLIAAGRLKIADMITHRFAPTDCKKAYDLLQSGDPSTLGVIFSWE